MDALIKKIEDDLNWRIVIPRAQAEEVLAALALLKQLIFLKRLWGY